MLTMNTIKAAKVELSDAAKAAKSAAGAAKDKASDTAELLCAVESLLLWIDIVLQNHAEQCRLFLVGNCRGLYVTNLCSDDIIHCSTMLLGLHRMKVQWPLLVSCLNNQPVVESRTWHVEWAAHSVRLCSCLLGQAKKRIVLPLPMHNEDVAAIAFLTICCPNNKPVVNLQELLNRILRISLKERWKGYNNIT